MKKNPGITLIALIITIIILLILAGIGISLLTQTGLFENAKQAKNVTENAQKDENDILLSYENKISEVGNVISGSRDTVTITQEEYNKLKNANTYSEDEIEIGTWINGKKIYRKTITGSTLPSNGTTLISNVDSVVNAYGEQLWNNTIWYHFPYLSIIRWELYNTDNTLRAQISDTNNTTAYKWTFEYIKKVE